MNNCQPKRALLQTFDMKDYTVSKRHSNFFFVEIKTVTSWMLFHTVKLSGPICQAEGVSINDATQVKARGGGACKYFVDPKSRFSHLSKWFHNLS